MSNRLQRFLSHSTPFRWLALPSGLLAVALLSAAGCCCGGGGGGSDGTVRAPPPVGIEVHVTPGITHINSVAVMPFRAEHELTGITVSDLLLNELLRTGRYQMLERSQLGSVLNESEIALAGISESKAMEIGNMVGADGVVIGTVDEYAMMEGDRGRRYAVVGLSVRLIDCSSGKVMWSASFSSRATDSNTPLSLHARAVVRGIVLNLSKSWKVQQYKPRPAPSSGDPNKPIGR